MGFCLTNLDLTRKLASLGADMRVLEPHHLAITMQGFFRQALLRYTEVQK